MKIINKNQDIEIKKLGELFELSHGNGKKSNTGTIPLYGSGGLIGMSEKSTNNGYSFTIGRKGTLNKPVFIKSEYSTIDTAFSTKNFSANPEYVFRIICGINLNKYSESSNRPSLTKKIIENIEVKLIKSLKQQEKIAQVLSMQEEQIERIKGLIKKLEKRNQYYAEKLLSGELRIRENKETGETELYENEEWQEVVLNGKTEMIPVGWGVEKLGENSTSVIKSGIKHFEGEKKYFATADIFERNNFISNGKNVTFENKESRANMSPKNNSVWFAKMKDTKKEIIFSDETNKHLINSIILSTGMCGLEVDKEKLDLNFLFEFICSDKFNNLKNNKCFGSTQKAINNENLKKINFNLPSLKEQKNISCFLKNKNNELESVKRILPQEEKRFQWMLDNLLSGEYEVVED